MYLIMYYKLYKSKLCCKLMLLYKNVGMLIIIVNVGEVLHFDIALLLV